MEDDPFWDSTPRQLGPFVSTEAFGGTIYWGGGRPFQLEAWESVLFDALDGSTPLAELRDDLIDTLDIDETTACAALGHTVRKLEHAGAVSGIERSGPEAPGHDAHIPSGELDVPIEIPDPDTGGVIVRRTTRNPEGNLVVEDLHPDGTRRLTTSFTMSAAQFSGGGSADARSPAELVPPHSCLGEKLRLAEPADRICVLHRGHRAVIRCDAPDVSKMLRRRLPVVEDADPELSGATEVFVVKPLEGIGPVRVFDRFGRRRGRPRTDSEVAELVLELLAEQIDGLAGCGPDTIRTRARALHSDAGCVMVPARLEQAGWRLWVGMRRRGLELSSTDVAFDRSSICSVPRLGGTARSLGPLRGILLVGASGKPAERRDLVTELVDPAIEAAERQEILERTVELVAGAAMLHLPAREGQPGDGIAAVLDLVAGALQLSGFRDRGRNDPL